MVCSNELKNIDTDILNKEIDLVYICYLMIFIYIIFSI